MFLESAGRPSAAADPKLEGAVGLTQILAETGPEPPGHARGPGGRAQADPPHRPRRAARPDGPRRPPPGPPAQGRPALRPRRLAARHRPLPEPGQGPAGRPRRLRGGRLPHGHRQPAVGAARLRAGPGQLHGAVLRQHALGPGPPPTAAWPASATTPRPTCGGSRRRSRSCAATARTARALEREDELQRAKNSSEEVLHPDGRHGVVRHPGRPGGRLPRRRRCARSPTPRRGWDCAATARWASWPGGSSSRGACTAACAPRPTPWPRTWRA